MLILFPSLGDAVEFKKKKPEKNNRKATKEYTPSPEQPFHSNFCEMARQN